MNVDLNVLVDHSSLESTLVLSVLGHSSGSGKLQKSGKTRASVKTSLHLERGVIVSYPGLL